MTTAKRFKHDKAVLETLPNELFLEVFGYLSGIDTNWAFAGLNCRLQALVSRYCDKFDFKAISKTKVDYVTRRHNMHQWRFLRLADDDQTPGQIPYFCRSFPFAENLSQLEALAVMNAKPSTASWFVVQLPSLTHLVSLSMGSVCGKTIPLLDLPTLKHLVTHSCMDTTWMKNLRLKTLQHTVERHCTHEPDLAWPTTTKHLKVFITQTDDNKTVCTALKSLPELVSLTLYDGAWESPPPDGVTWQELITSSMPLLKSFKFCFKFWRDLSSASDVRHIVSTFSTPFYLQEKSWFVRCDAHHRQFSIALLYSLPFAFERFEIVTHSFKDSITTSSSGLTSRFKRQTYRHVKTLLVSTKCKPAKKILPSKRIVNLSITHSSALATWIFALSGLRQLTLGRHINMSSTEFLGLLKASPHLKSLIVPYYTLQFITDQWRDKRICGLLSLQICSLNVSSTDCSDEQSCSYTKVDELLPIVKVFGAQCRHLSIVVYSRNIVAGLLLRCMNQLRSLKVRLKEHSDDLQLTKEWLVQQSETFQDLDCSIVADGSEYSFWFGRHSRQ